MRRLRFTVLALLLAFALAASALAAQGFTFNPTDGYWYSPPLVAGSNLDFSIDWKNRLAGDTIVSSSWRSPSGLPLGTTLLDSTNTVATVWVSGGAAGQNYIVINTVTTSGSRVFVCPFKIPVVDH